MIARLGKETDVTLARELGITASAVRQKRRSLGITRFVRRRHWTAGERRWLGRLKDAEVARRLGLAAPTVTVMRRSLGIPRPSRNRKRRSG